MYSEYDHETGRAARSGGPEWVRLSRTERRRLQKMQAKGYRDRQSADPEVAARAEAFLQQTKAALQSMSAALAAEKAAAARADAAPRPRAPPGMAAPTSLPTPSAVGRLTPGMEEISVSVSGSMTSS